jgi:hypothetical protein
MQAPLHIGKTWLATASGSRIAAQHDKLLADRGLVLSDN